MDLALVLTWTVLTLGIAALSTYLGIRYGKEFPIAMMAVLVVAANLFANKLVLFGSIVVPAGVLVASATFLVTDILSELWDRETASRAVWVGFFALLCFTVTLIMVDLWPAAPFAIAKADAFHLALGQTPRIAFASLVAYLISQHHDVWAYDMWKRRLGGRHLWLRNNASTIVSQLIDSVVFATIAFYGVLPLIPLIGSLWLVKTLIAVLDTPFIYAVRRLALQTSDNLDPTPVETIASR